VTPDIYHENANKAELRVKSECTAVAVKPARKTEISAELTAPESPLRPEETLKAT